MAIFWWNAKSIIRGFSPILGTFSQYEIMLSLECAVDSEWNDILKFIVSSELFICKSHKNQAFNMISIVSQLHTSTITIDISIKSFLVEINKMDDSVVHVCVCVPVHIVWVVWHFTRVELCVNTRSCCSQIWRRSDMYCMNILHGHTGSVLCLQYDENVIITGSSDSTIRLD